MRAIILLILTLNILGQPLVAVKHEADYASLIEKIEAWVKSEEKIITALIVGSRARSEQPADQYSDLDIGLVVSDIAPWISDLRWTESFGQNWVRFVEDGWEVRVLYAPGLEVDFCFVTPNQLTNKGATLKRGYRFLKVTPELRQVIEQISSQALPATQLPDERTFLNNINDFWYHCQWVAKKLQRGELLTAKETLDEGYIKSRNLYPMLRWHHLCKNPTAAFPWHGVRFFEQWADPAVVNKIAHTCSRYDAESLWSALFATMNLYSSLSRETAQQLGFPYPVQVENQMQRYVHELYRK